MDGIFQNFSLAEKIHFFMVQTYFLSLKCQWCDCYGMDSSNKALSKKSSESPEKPVRDGSTVSFASKHQKRA